MVLFYAEILRSVFERDNSWKPLASNDPAISAVSLSKDAGVTATSDGDILSLSGTDATHAAYSLNFIHIPTATYPYLVIRARGVGTLDAVVTYVASANTTFTMNLTSAWQTFTFSMTSGQDANLLLFRNQSVAGVNQLHYFYVCGKTPLQLSQRDLVNGTVTRTSLGVDHAELLLNNKAGKFVTGSNAFGFGDHLHIYLGQASTLYHVYGGYVELQEPTMPADEITIHSRGFGLPLLRSKVLQIYNNTTPRGIFNDVLDNWVNPASKNGITALRPYQLTRSYVQDLGSAFPLYVTNMNHAYNVLAEIGDQTVAQNNSAIFFVDPAENLHFVPLGAQGTANWTTDSFPALYGTKIAVGSNTVITKLTYDSKSLANRVHYYGIAQIPGQVDDLTEYANDSALQAAWNIGGFGGGLTNASPKAETTAALHSVTSPVAIGGKSNQLDMTNNGSGGFTDVGGNMNINFTSPTQIGLGAIDFTKLGSQWSPPLLEAYFRIHVTGQPVGDPTGTGYYSLLFFKDNANYFEYQLTSSLANAPFYDSVLNAGSHATQDFWYHTLVPIGPNAGNLFLSAPAPNIIPQPTSGDPPWKAATTGTPNWNLINGLAFYGTYTGSTATNQAHVQMFLDGLRIIGGRYRLAYDSASLANGAYPDMSEAFFYDPISKDELAIKSFARAELERLRRPIIRGTVVLPLKADIVPEQQVQFNIPSANLSNVYLRCTSVTHHFSQSGFLTELGVSNDFRNSQPLDQWKLANVLAQMGENAIFSRELFDLRTAVLDPTFSAITDGYS